MNSTQTSSFLNPKTVFWTLIILVVLRGALYTFVVPPWQHPEEPSHFELVRLIADLRKFPEKEDISIEIRRDITSSMVKHGFWDPDPPPPLDDNELSKVGGSPLGVWSFRNPRLYFVVSAVWLWPWRSTPIDTQLFITRQFSVLLNVVVAVCAFQIAKIFFPNHKWFPLLVMTFVVFQPVNTDIMSAVNNDSLVNTLGALFFLTWAVTFHKGLNIVRGISILLICVLAILTKSTGLVLLATLPFALIFYLLGVWRVGNTPFLILLAVIILVLVVVVWQFGVLEDWLDNFIPSLGRYLRVNIEQTIEGLVESYTLNRLQQATPVVFQSYWGAFGWRHILIAPVWYWLIFGAMLLSIIGLVINAVRWLRPKVRFDRNIARTSFLIYAFVAVAMAWVITILRSLVAGPSPYLSHGRYILIALTPFTLLFTYGLCQMFKGRWQTVAGAVFAISIVGFDAICFWGFLVPFYY
jgi:hypothetical protein